jgi:hypothetical protein
VQARDLDLELEHFGPEETLATVSGLDPSDELSRLISASYRTLAEAQRGHAVAIPGRCGLR